MLTTNLEELWPKTKAEALPTVEKIRAELGDERDAYLSVDYGRGGSPTWFVLYLFERCPPNSGYVPNYRWYWLIRAGSSDWYDISPGLLAQIYDEKKAEWERIYE